MTIELMYVHGISYEDTPFFSNIERQSEYFYHHIVKEIDTSYYPPKYKNSIKVDIGEDGDIEFNTKINYLRLVFKSKEYYYFIDKVEYISETTMILHVTMDVIQTYYFDIEIVSGIIERKMINRWIPSGSSSVPWSINRSYIRENVSEGVFEIPNFYNELNTDTSKYLIFGKFTKAPTQQTYDVPSIYHCEVSNGVYVPMFSAYQYLFTPLFESKVGNTNEDIRPLNTTVSYIDYVVDLYCCPFDCIDPSHFNGPTAGTHGNYYNYDGTHVELVEMTYSGITASEKKVYHVTGANFRTKQYDCSLPFESNDSIRINYNSKYIPCLIDENYIKFEFGSYVEIIEYPLFRLTYTHCYCNYSFMLDTGYRIYSITPTKDYNDTKDRIITVDTNVLSFDLINNAWNTYLANNKNRWASLALNGGNTIIQSTVKSGMKYGGAGAIVGGVMGVADTGVKVANQFLNEGNLQNASGKPKSTNQYNSSYINKNSRIFVAYTKCQDFEKCALYYHMYGNLVNEIVLEQTDLFTHVNTRYYFNYLKMRDVNVHLNLIESEDEINKIHDRLIDGIRLWNVTEYLSEILIGTYKYDNVEKAFLS